MNARFYMPKITRPEITKVLLSVVFITMVFLPLIKMFTYMDINTVERVFASPVFLKAIVNSLTYTTLSTIITVILAFVLAICIERTKIRFKGIFGVLFTLPMLIPSISSGMGLVILFGNNGIVTKVFNLNGSIYGLTGIIVGSLMYAFPVAYLMLADVIRYEDYSPYEAAKVLGVPKKNQFTAIMLPYLRKPLISVFFATFTLIITDYGVPLMVGGKYITVASVMYQEVIGQLDFGKGAVYGSLLLIPAVVAFVVDLLNKNKNSAVFIAKECPLSDKKMSIAVSYLICVLVGLFTLLPLLSFVLSAFTTDYPNNLTFTLQNIGKAIKLRADEYLLNSVLIAFLTALTGTIIAFFAAYLSARMKSAASKFLHLSAMTSAAIPGVVLGLSYVLAFNKTPIYSTIIILVMVNIVHFIASPYLMMYNSMSKINENLEGVAHTLGISRLNIIKDVFVPQCKGTLIEMFTFFFVNCMMTISAVSFLASTTNKPVSLMINQFEAQMQLECAAVVSLMILTINTIIKALTHFVRKKKI